MPDLLHMEKPMMVRVLFLLKLSTLTLFRNRTDAFHNSLFCYVSQDLDYITHTMSSVIDSRFMPMFKQLWLGNYFGYCSIVSGIRRPF